jgi:hypothetical protein
MKHVNDPLPLPRSLDKTIPAEMEQIVLKALAKDPADRYQSAGEMIQAVSAAADQLDTTLPERISAPDFTVAAQPTGVAVLSGVDRERVTDVPLVSDETDIDIQVEQAMRDEAAPSPKTGEAASVAIPPELSKYRPKIVFVTGNSSKALKGFLPAVVILIGYNLTAVLLALISDNWGIYEYGWPIEMLIISFGLIQIMTALESPWMMVPVGLFGGMGVLLSFYSVTGAWALWNVLWPLVPLLVLGTVLYTIWLNGRGERKMEIIQWTARRSSQLIFITALIVAGLSFIV